MHHYSLLERMNEDADRHYKYTSFLFSHLYYQASDDLRNIARKHAYRNASISEATLHEIPSSSDVPQSVSHSVLTFLSISLTIINSTLIVTPALALSPPTFHKPKRCSSKNVPHQPPRLPYRPKSHADKPPALTNTFPPPPK